MSISLPHPIANLHGLFSQIHTHGEAGIAAANAAIHAPNTQVRLTDIAKSYDAFDHAIVDAHHIPLASHFFGKYYAGYEAAKVGAGLIIATGAVPGARQILGQQELASAQQHLHQGAALATPSASHVDQYKATDWLNHSLSDATDSLLQLHRPDLAKPLLGGLLHARQTVSSGGTISSTQMGKLDSLFSSAGHAYKGLVQTIQAAAAHPNDATLQAKASTLLARDNDLPTWPIMPKHSA